MKKGWMVLLAAALAFLPAQAKDKEESRLEDRLRVPKLAAQEDGQQREQRAGCHGQNHRRQAATATQQQRQPHQRGREHHRARPVK